MEALEFAPSIQGEIGPCELENTPKAAFLSEVSKSKPEDLVARAIVPVKAEFLLPNRSRLSSDVDGEQKIVVAEKKSKRQLKKERQQVCRSVFEKMFLCICLAFALLF